MLSYLKANSLSVDALRSDLNGGFSKATDLLVFNFWTNFYDGPKIRWAVDIRILITLPSSAKSLLALKINPLLVDGCNFFLV